MSLFEDINALIKIIGNIYNMINEEWVAYLTKLNKEKYIDKNGKPKLSLKKTIASMKSDWVMYDYVLLYRQFLVDKLESTDFNIRSRIKATNSIQSKIDFFIYHKNEKGMVPILKCLNDIFGLRYEIEDNFTFEQIIKHIKLAFPKLKVEDASKQEYSAIHVYFRNGKFYFPIELQIWYKKDHDKNTRSHAKYKQGYTTWEDDNKTDKIN